MNDNHDKLIKEYIKLAKQKKDLKAQLEELTSTMGAYEGEILEYFQQTGTKSMRRDDMTVYVQEQLWAKTAEGATGQEAVQVLHETGLDEYTMISTSGLSSLMRAWKDEGREPPAEFAGVIDTSMKYTLKARLSK